MRTDDYQKILELKQLIDSGEANSNQKREYMKILFNNGHISESQYQKYLNDQTKEDILGAGLVIGGFLLVSWLIGKLLD